MSQRITDIQKRLEAASKGPWQAGQGATSDGADLCTTYEQKAAFLALSLNDGGRPLWLVDNAEVIPAVTGDGPNAQANAEFIAHGPADVAYLLAELRKRDEALEEFAAGIEKALAIPTATTDAETRGYDNACRDTLTKIRQILAPDEP